MTTTKQPYLILTNKQLFIFYEKPQLMPLYWYQEIFCNFLNAGFSPEQKIEHVNERGNARFINI